MHLIINPNYERFANQKFCTRSLRIVCLATADVCVIFVLMGIDHLNEYCNFEHLLKFINLMIIRND